MLPFVTNLPRGVNPYYPRAWDQRVADYLTSDSARLLAQLAAAVESRAAWARLFLGCRLHRSVAMCLAWRARDLALERKAARLAQLLEEARSDAAKGFLARGPVASMPSNQDQLYATLAGHWYRCSLQMHRLCEASDIRYFGDNNLPTTPEMRMDTNPLNGRYFIGNAPPGPQTVSVLAATSDLWRTRMSWRSIHASSAARATARRWSPWRGTWRRPRTGCGRRRNRTANRSVSRRPSRPRPGQRALCHEPAARARWLNAKPGTEPVHAAQTADA